MEPFFGRTELEWEELEAVGWDLLLDCTVTLTTYADLNRRLAEITGQSPWDFDNPAHRRAIAHLLGRLADRSYGECVSVGLEPLMISALCKYTHKDDAGPGFYDKARELGLIPDAVYRNKSERFLWWATHAGKVQDWLKARCS